MEEKIIGIRHRACDYECMWNGIEDLFRHKGGQELPAHFFFCLSGIGNFVYLKSKQGGRFASWNDGRTKQMYKSVSDVIGFQYRFIEGRRFSFSMQKAKQLIDEGKPVILGCLDMYHLEYYPKFFEKQHIPMHYVLMVGYSDDKQCVYVFDCGKDDVQQISYERLEKALDIEKTNFSNKNTVCLIDFEENPRNVIDIATKGFQRKAELLLSPPAGHIGVPGMRKLAKEIGSWKAELTEDDYQNSLQNFVMYTGTVPALPQRLTGVPGDDNIRHRASREKLARLFAELGQDYAIDEWRKAAEYFEQSGRLIEEMTNRIVAHLLGRGEGLKGIPELILDIAAVEEQAFGWVLRGCE